MSKYQKEGVFGAKARIHLRAKLPGWWVVHSLHRPGWAA